MLSVIGLHGSLQGSQCAVHLLIYGHIDLCAGSPDHHNALAVVLCLEIADILAQCLHHLPACFAVLHIVTIQTFGIILVKCSLHGHNLLQFFSHGFNVFLLEHLGIHGCLIGVLWIYVPGSKNKVVELSQWHHLAIREVFCVFALTHTNLVVLSH